MTRTNLGAIILIAGFMIIKQTEAATDLEANQLLKEDQNYRNNFDQLHYRGINPIEDSKEYHIISDVAVTFAEAKRKCSDRKMMLATVRSAGHNDQLFSRLNNVSRVNPDNRFWIGGEWLENDYYWSHCADKFDYTNWAEGQPHPVEKDSSLYLRNCVEILPSSNGFKWGLNFCDQKNAVVCEAVPHQPARQFRDMTYIFGVKKISIEEAILECRRQGRYLASLETRQERNYLRKYMDNIDNPEFGVYWIHNGDNKNLYSSKCDYYHAFPKKPKCHRVEIRNDTIDAMLLRSGPSGCSKDREYALCEKQVV